MSAELTNAGILSWLGRMMTGSVRLQGALAAELGLTGPDLTAMTHLAEQPDMQSKELSALLGITTGSTTGITDRLERAGYVVRTPNPADRRSVLLRLSPAGSHAVEWMLDEYRGAFETSVKNHPPEVLKHLGEFMNDLGIAFERMAAEHTKRPAKRTPPARP